jgi:hypothetical protein
MNNDVNHSIALRALGWEPLKTERKKAKAKMMYKVLNKMGPKSLTNLFSYKSEKTNYNLREISSDLSLPNPRTNNMKNSFMYDGAHQRKLGKAKLFLPLEIKLLLTSLT